MSIIAEYESASTYLLDTLQAVPAMTIRHDELYFTPSGSVRWIFWACGEDQSAFEEALGDDPTVEQYQVTTDIPEKRLYSVTLVDSPADLTTSIFTELGVQILAATHSHSGTTVRVRCPSREAFLTVKAAVEERYGKFVTRRLYKEEDAPMAGFNVTPHQREALLCALERGHFDVPRKSDLRTIASELGISDQALSSRLRRGTAALLEDTLAREQTSDD